MMLHCVAFAGATATGTAATTSVPSLSSAAAGRVGMPVQLGNQQQQIGTQQQQQQQQPVSAAVGASANARPNAAQPSALQLQQAAQWEAHVRGLPTDPALTVRQPASTSKHAS